MENSKQFSNSANSKYNQFLNDINNGNYVEKKINHFLKNEFEEVFSEILIINKQQFIDQIKKGVSLSLEDLYSEKCLTNEKLLNLIEASLLSITNDYINIYNFLSKSWSNHEKISKRKGQEEEMLTIFRKHCINTDEYAYHNCEFKNNNFIVINEENQNKKNKYIICIACKRVYLSSFILCRCNKCNVDYYTNVLNTKEEMDLLPATWDNYHCAQIINEKMKCIKCKEVFYLNMKTGNLVCLNKKCGFISKPSRILWTCTVCKKDFKSGCIPYNPLDLIIIKRTIRQTLLVKHLAHPNRVPCCKINVFFTSFYHKNACKGILYVGELNNSLIIVCDICHAINFYDRFIWTCPKCGKRFRDKVKILPNNDNNNKNSNNNEEIEKKPSIKNIISSRRTINNNNENNLNNNKTNTNVITTNNINTNTNIIIEDSPKRRFRGFKKNSNNSGYFNLEGVKDILNQIEESSSQTIENNKVQTNNDIKKDRIKYFQKYREKKEKEKREKEEKEKEEKEKEEKEKEEKEKEEKEKEEKEKEEKEKEEKEKEEKEKEEKEKSEKEKIEKEKEEKKKEEKEEKLKNEISERKRIKEKRNIIRNDIYYRKQIDEKGKKSRFKFSYNLTEEVAVNKEDQKNLINEGNKMKNENKKSDNIINNDNNNNNKKSFCNKINDNDEENITSRTNQNNINNNNKINHKKHIKNKSSHNNEEEIEGDDEEEIEEEEIENHNKNKDNKNENNNNIKRRPEGRKTKGQEIKEDSSQELKPKDNNINIPMSNISGISEHLLNYINKRMNFILSRSKIPLIKIEEYILYKKLGEGSYGVIYSVFKQNEKKLYALKKIVAHTLNEIDEFTKEFELVHSCEHKNIMKIYGICLRTLDSSTYALYVLMELSNGDWDKEIRLHLQQRKNYTEFELINILYQLTTALLFMQEKLKVSHRDIKPQNILTFNGNIYKLADFGEAKEVKISKQINTLRGTELYMSPALYDGLKHEKDDVSHNPFKSDVFSLGFCFLYAAALNFNLLYEVRDINDSKTINIILRKNLKKNYSERFIFILGKMLEIDENKRYDFPSLIKDITSFYNINIS